MELTIEPHGAGNDGPDDAAARIHYAGPLTRRPLKRSEEAARLIVREIMDRRLQPGELLASETAMLESYRVSRESLREALRLRETQGLVELRRGRGGGALVGAVDASNLGRLSTLYYQLEGGTYDDLLEAWVFAESALAEAAARNPGLMARKTAMDAFTRSSFGEASCHRAPVFEELAFHRAIAGLAENPVLRLMLASVHAVVAPQVISHVDMELTADESSEEHVAIARAVRAGHAARAKQLTDAHTRRLVDACRTQIGDRVDRPIDWI
jgi:GntR family transcriptional regulator, transcriptional repressor for pyruvate dehydrogenase complex